MPSEDLHMEIGADILNLLHAMPNPAGVFRATEGYLLAANEHFCSVLSLPGEEADRILNNGDGGKPADHLQFRVRIIDENIAHFESPSGVRPLIDADIRTVELGGNPCWLITPAMETWQGASEKMNFETGHFRALLENLNEIIYFNDKNANVAYVSPNIFRLTGYEAHEVIGKSFTHFVHPDDLEGRIEVFLKILNGEEQATEYRMITKAGEIKWARTNARPVIRDGEVIGIQGALVEVTDLKEIEEALRLSEEKYRNVVQNSKDAIFVTQGDYLRFMNPSALEILGYSFDLIADRPFWEFIHPDDREMITERYRRRLAGETFSDIISFRIITRNGDVKDVELNAVLIVWEEKPAVLNFLRDVTVQKKMENQLRNAQKMEALGTLSGGIAHNFNNLLMGIHGNASLSMADLTPSTPSYKYMEKIVSLVQSGSKLTRQLLEYARGKASEMETVDINKLVRDVSDTLAATRKQIQIRFRLSEELPPIKADLGQVEQVMLNLLLNSADAMPDGGEVFIETACLRGDQAEGKVTLSKRMNYIMIKVADQGIGIPRKDIDRIFEPFFTTKGLGRGTGLGLSTAYGIIKNHDGDICVESQLGKGSTFFIYLPALTADDIYTCDIPEAGKVFCHGTVLLIDDEPNVLYPSAELLEHLGFSVVKAINGAIAMEMFQSKWQNIDLVILDLILPDTSGKELFYSFKEIDPQVKVLISSGYSQEGQAETLIEEGCLGFVQKPYDVAKLSTMMMEIICR